MKNNQNSEIVVFDNNSFFKNNQKFYIQLSTDLPEFVGVMHKHKFVEVVYILSGTALHTVGGKQYEVNRGDVIVINCGVAHKFTAKADSKDLFIAYDLMFASDFFDSLSINMDDFEALKNSFLFYSLFPDDIPPYPDMHISGGRYFDYGEIFTRIFNEYKSKEKGYVELIRAYVIELVIKIFREVEKTDSSALIGNIQKPVNEAINYIEKNYNTKLSVGDIAAKVFLSPDYFRKLFKKVTGESVSSFYQRVRIEEACRLLATTSLPIKDICADIGYSDIKPFYQAFKKFKGITPQEYRKKQ